MKKWLSGFLLVLAVGLVLAGCKSEGAADQGSTEDIDQEIVVNAMSEPPDLDPALATDTTSGWVLDHVFEGLYTKDKEGNPVLGTASDVQVSEDGKTYTFTIRDDATWSDGSPVTAQDFEYGWKRVLNPDTGSSFAFYMYYIKGAEAYNKGEASVDDVGVTAKDEKTLVVDLEAPLGYFDELLTMWTFYPVKQDVVESDANWSASEDTYVSNGPFKLTSWEHDSQVVIEKNEEYWDKGVVKLDKVTYEMVNDATTYYQMFKTNELDLIQTLPTDVIDQEKDSEEYKETPYFGTYMYMFNVDKEPFTNAKIRRAFTLAVDRTSLTENVSKAGETPAYAFVPEGVETPEGDFREIGGAYFEEDAEKAKQLLQEGMEEEGWDELPEVTLLYNTSENHKKIAEAVQEMYSKNLGVDIKLSNQEWKTYLDTTEQGNFQMARMGWIGVLVDPVVILDYYLGDSPNNRTNWVNEEYDELIAQAKVEQDEQKRYDLLHQAEEVLMEDLPFNPIYHYTNTYLTSQNFKDIVYPVNRYPYLKWAQKVSE
ncbi:peptide ABC transporter substrate-binding protein [Sediminibacillus halophilus]|uniref:Oligopeptide transport system substrate-binding protein n=1 Tax=Sediminibacillus halophilus TaxID=482461 RepID=A0A1G9RXR2_9BACI|nr:peptide ABC transporter substrate-binding protein [Sediminibacillus halophilus]SDM27807.1 oligopeptide transport system substrate-binding protein [Sediminibacillus halophilus]